MFGLIAKGAQTYERMDACALRRGSLHKDCALRPDSGASGQPRTPILAAARAGPRSTAAILLEPSACDPNPRPTSLSTKGAAINRDVAREHRRQRRRHTDTGHRRGTGIATPVIATPDAGTEIGRSGHSALRPTRGERPRRGPQAADSLSQNRTTQDRTERLRTDQAESGNSRATPLATAARATAPATLSRSRGSNGFGMM